MLSSNANDDINSYEPYLLTLQSSSSSVEDKIIALRYLYNFINKSNNLDTFTRLRINQVVYESVLELTMTEERTPDLRKRQLIRTECFLILANILESNCLFGDTKNMAWEETRKHGKDESAHKEQPQPDLHPELHLDLSNEGFKKYVSERLRQESANERSPSRQLSSGSTEETSTVTNTKRSPSVTTAGSPQPSRLQSRAASISVSEHRNTNTLQANKPTDRRLSSRSPSIVSTQRHSFTADMMNSTMKRSKSASASSSNIHPVNKATSDGSSSPKQSRGTKSDSIDEMKYKLYDMDEMKEDDHILSSQLQDTPALLTASTILSSKEESKSNLIRNILSRPIKHHSIPKKFRSRPFIFYSNDYQLESIVPGVDPSNWLEQDRKLGYQKSRMWFPMSALRMRTSMLPDDRQHQQGSTGLMTITLIIHDHTDCHFTLSSSLLRP
jgi:hypothetical protein